MMYSRLNKMEYGLNEIMIENCHIFILWMQQILWNLVMWLPRAHENMFLNKKMTQIFMFK